MRSSHCWTASPHPHHQSCCKDFKGCFVGSLGCIRDLTKVEVKALSFPSFFFFATVNLLILQSVEQQWINLFKVCIHKENLNFSGLNAWPAVWWLKGRHLQVALEGGGSALSPAPPHRCWPLGRCRASWQGRRKAGPLCATEKAFPRTGRVVSSSHRKQKKEKVKGHVEGQNGLNLVNVRGYSF